MLKLFTILALCFLVPGVRLALAQNEDAPLNLMPETLVPQTAPVPDPETQGDESLVMTARAAEVLVMKLEREIAVLEALFKAQAQLNEDDLIRGRRLPLSLCLASPLKGDCKRLGATFGEAEP